MGADVLGHAIDAQALLTTAGLMLASATLGAAAGSNLSSRDTASVASQSQSSDRHKPILPILACTCHVCTAHGMTQQVALLWKHEVLFVLTFFSMI